MDFAKRLLQQHPGWEPYLGSYVPKLPADSTEPGSLWLEVSTASHAGSRTITLSVQSSEALLRIDDRERLFVWPVGEREAAYEEVLGALAAALG